MDGLKLVKKVVEYRITYCLKCGNPFTGFITTDGKTKEYCVMCGHSWDAVKFGDIKKGEIKID